MTTEIEVDRRDVDVEGINSEMSNLSCRIVDVEKNLSESEKRKRELEYSVTVLNDLLSEESIKNTVLSESVSSLQSTVLAVKTEVLSLEELVAEQREDLDAMVRSEAVIVGEAEALRRRAEAAEKTGQSTEQRCQ